MGKKLTPYEKVDNFITKCYDTEIDKWNAGLSNNMEEWESFLTYWNLIEDVKSLRKDNAELRVYNNKLLEENQKLQKNKKNIERVKILLSKEMLYKYLGLNLGRDVLDYANKYIDDILKDGE